MPQKEPYVIKVSDYKVRDERRSRLRLRKKDLGDQYDIDKLLEQIDGFVRDDDTYPPIRHVPYGQSLEAMNAHFAGKLHFEKLSILESIWISIDRLISGGFGVVLLIIGINVLFFIPKLLGLLFALACFAAPFYFAYMKREQLRKQIFAPFLVILWFGVMLVSVGTIGVPQLYGSIGSFICPPGYSADTVVTTTVKEEPGSYESSTSAAPVCRNRAGEEVSISMFVGGAVLFVLYVALSMLLVLIGRIVNELIAYKSYGYLRFVIIPAVFAVFLYILYKNPQWITPISGWVNQALYAA